MPIYKILKLKNEDSVIGFPFVGYCESDGSFINYGDGFISIDPDFSSQHENDIDCYLDDYNVIPTTIEFDFDELKILLNKKSERPLSLQYHSKDGEVIITHHWQGNNPAYEEVVKPIEPNAKRSLDKLIAIFNSLE